MPSFVLAIDQGTTSSRAIIFDDTMQAIAQTGEEFTQHFPRSGWVEHDPQDIWQTTVRTCRQAIEKARINPLDVAAIGITNQRETTLVWDRETGQPIHNAIVWQDRRTARLCDDLKQAGHEDQVRSRTGLLLDPYFSATKLAWLLDHVEGVRARAEDGKLAFGTVDTWLIWHLSGGKAHVTDATNAARTMLYNIHAGTWDEELLALFKIPPSLLPQVKNSADDFATTDRSVLGAEIPVLGVAGDQQAATIGQACFQPGMVKSTYGTGCFALLNTGKVPVTSSNRLLTTIAYQLDGEPIYALEGSIFVAGAVVQWLRDGLGIIEHAEQTQSLAEAADPNQEVLIVPAFTGLGAPHWDPQARGAIFGLTRNSGPREFARASLESVGYQTRELVEAMQGDWPQGQDGGVVLRVDGGMSASDYAMQFLADILDAPVDRPQMLETTALGAAYLAGLKAGLYGTPEAFAAAWQLQRRFTPNMDGTTREHKYAAWKTAVRKLIPAVLAL